MPWTRKQVKMWRARAAAGDPVAIRVVREPGFGTAPRRSTVRKATKAAKHKRKG